MAGFLGSKKVVTGKTDTSKAVVTGGGEMPDNTLANCMIERAAYRDASESEYHVKKHGKEACENAINVMLRIKETKDGKYLKKCVFATLFMASAATGAADQKKMSMMATCAGEQDQNLEGLHAEIFDGDDWPADEVLGDLIGTMVGVKIGVFKADGKTNEFIREIQKPYEFAAAGPSTSAPAGGRTRQRRQR